MKQAPNDKRTLPFGGAMAIKNPDIIAAINSVDYQGCLDSETITEEFCETYKQWIQASSNKLTFNKFKYSVFSNGTTQAFEMFYIKHKHRRFRCFRGDYIYHQLAWKNNAFSWCYIDDDAILTNDAVVISLPFANTGNIHYLTEMVLNQCDRYEVPVLIDCVYFGTSINLHYDLDRDCITDIVFSLSKTFPVANARIGMRLTKVDDDDLMFVYDKINYNNRLSAKLGIELINKFQPDYITNIYRSQQLDFCKQLGVEPSNTILFGLDKKNQYPEYNRGGEENRLSFHQAFLNKELIKHASTNK
jgi:hypothetical protein